MEEDHDSKATVIIWLAWVVGLLFAILLWWIVL